MTFPASSLMSWMTGPVLFFKHTLNCPDWGTGQQHSLIYADALLGVSPWIAEVT